MTEIKASSPRGFEDAVKEGLLRASKTLKNIKPGWVQNQKVIVDSAGKITEHRVHPKVAFVLED